MKRTAVINVVGLTEALIGEHTPRLAAFRARGALAHIAPAFPAVTCTAQANYLTGKTPAQHGIVGNGWYHRDLAEVQFWRQSNHLVQAPKIWDALRAQPAIANRQSPIANCFWWFNMYSSVDYALTPRPIYRADGGKIFDIYSWPYSLRAEIKTGPGRISVLRLLGAGGGRQNAARRRRLRHALDCRIRQVDGKQILPGAESRFTCRIWIITCNAMG